MWGRTKRAICTVNQMLVFYPDVTGGENFLTVDVLSQFHHYLMLTNNV